jgi:hypothetical protein
VLEGLGGTVRLGISTGSSKVRMLAASAAAGASRAGARSSSRPRPAATMSTHPSA